MDFFVEKDTDLMRSTFIAVGLAALFEQLPYAGQQHEVRLIDQGSAYQIHVPYDRDRAQRYLDARGKRLPPLIPAIRKAFSENEKKELEANPDSDVRHKYVPREFTGTIVEYEQEKEIAKAAPKKRSKEARQEGDAPSAHPDYPLWAHLCSYFNKGSSMRVGYPSVLHTWHAHEGEVAAVVLDALIDCYSDFPNDMSGLRAWWIQEISPAIQYHDFEIDLDVSSLAIVSPSTAKGGYSKTAAAGLTEDTPKEFWLVMYLAFAGFMIVAMPFTLGKDVLTFYPLPRDIELRILRAEMDAYRDNADARSLYSFSNLMLRPKLDSLAIITFYQSLVSHFRAAVPIGFLDEYANSYSGLVGYYYKDIGGTQIAFDEAIFALPSWLPHTASADEEALSEAEALLKKLHDMASYLRGKSPKHKLTAEELIVLNAYRSFISTGDVDAWVELAIQYNSYHFHMMGDLFMPDLPLDMFERIIARMDTNIQSSRKPYRAILENEGFQNVAAAIRHCTVTTRYLESVRKIDTGFKVRHGLGDDLLRHAKDADPNLFIEDLTRFLHDYARESSSVQANDASKTRPFVTDADLLQVIDLVDQYGTGPVAHLLVAAGYSSAYRKSETN